MPQIILGITHKTEEIKRFDINIYPASNNISLASRFEFLLKIKKKKDTQKGIRLNIIRSEIIMDVICIPMTTIRKSKFKVVSVLENGSLQQTTSQPFYCM